MTEIKELIRLQREYFQTGATRNPKKRILFLKALETSVREMEYTILEALYSDLGKSEAEGYMSEVGMVLSEIRYMQKHLTEFAKMRKVRTPLAHFPAKSCIKPCPYGTVLIMSPWNYPFLLTVGPLVDALAAGNTAILKIGKEAAATGRVLAQLVRKTFPPQLVTVVQGGRAENSRLLEEKFDYIFFTGGKEAGRTVLEKAARHLTPVSLELGGKSPCIVDESADVALAARRIVFGKFLNSGQTCVAPDYLLVHKRKKEALLSCMEKEICRQFGPKPLENPDYGKIINEKHFRRLMDMLEGENIRSGAGYDLNCRIEPTIVTDVAPDSPLMQEEIFGPILPVLEFDTLQEAEDVIKCHPAPLALYLFTKKKSVKNRITSEISFGGGCINDTIIHLASPYLGFGGVGESGMGAYHGKCGFDTFTHYKSLVEQTNRIDLPFRYAPYTGKKLKFIKRFMG